VSVDEARIVYVLRGTWRDKECVVAIRSDMRVHATSPEVAAILRTAVAFETYFDVDPLPARQMAFDPENPLHLAIFLDGLVYWETLNVEPVDTFPAPPEPAQFDKVGLVY
jgi:hypothetical protein